MVLGLCLHMDDCGLLAWISPTALHRTYFMYHTAAKIICYVSGQMLQTNNIYHNSNLHGIIMHRIYSSNGKTMLDFIL